MRPASPVYAPGAQTKPGYGFWAMVDQGIVSLGAFVTNVLLARKMAPEDYGLYSVLLGVLLFFNSIHSSAVTYPLSVKGAVAEVAKLKRLTAAALRLTTVLAVPLGLALVLAATYTGKPALGGWLLAALFFWQVQETLRRSLMAHSYHHRAVAGDIVSYLGQAGILLVVSLARAPKVETVLLVMTVTSAAAASLQAAQIRLRPGDLTSSAPCGQAFWRLGRWVLLANLAAAFCAQSFGWTLLVAGGARAAASYQAVINLLGAIHPVMFGLSNLIVPGAAQVWQQTDVRCAWLWARKQAAWGGVILFPYFALLLFNPGGILTAFYGPDSPYLTLEAPVRLCVLAYVATYFAHIAGAFLAGLEQPRDAFRIHLLSALASIAAGLPLAAAYGVTGACAGLLVVSVVRVSAGIIQVMKHCEVRPLAVTR